MLWRVSRPIRTRSKPPGFIMPCQPALADRPPSGPGWLHEIKFDGYRVIARKDGEQVRLWARLERTTWAYQDHIRQRDFYSKTSSTRARNAGEIVKPRTFAFFALTTSSNLLAALRGGLRAYCL